MAGNRDEQNRFSIVTEFLTGSRPELDARKRCRTNDTSSAGRLTARVSRVPRVTGGDGWLGLRWLRNLRCDANLGNPGNVGNRQFQFEVIVYCGASLACVCGAS